MLHELSLSGLGLDKSNYTYPVGIDRSSASPSKSTKGRRVETRVVGNVYGRDLRAEVEVYPDGTTIFDHQPPEIEILNKMYEFIKPGVHKIPGYEYPITILPSENCIFSISDDPYGNKQALAEVYLLGDHYMNSVGDEIPAGKAWSRVIKGFDGRGVPFYENETRGFMSLYYSVFEPDKISGHLIRQDLPGGEYAAAAASFSETMRDEVKIQRMRRIRRHVEEYQRAMLKTSA